MAYEWGESGTARATGLNRYSIAGDYRAAQSTAGGGAWGSWLLSDSLPKSSGLWLYEVTAQRFTTGEVFIGLGSAADLPVSGTVTPKAGADTVCLYLNDGKLWTNGAAVGSGPGASAYSGHPMANITSRVFTVIFNASTRKMWVKAGGTYVFDAAGDPLAGTNEAITIGGAGALEPMVGMFRNSNGQLVLHGPDQIQYPVAGATPLGYVPASITFAAGAVVDAAGAAVTEAGVVVSVCDRATGVQIAATTVSLSAGGGTTATFAADVTNGQSVVCHLHNASGTFKSYGQITTVTV